MQNTEHFDFALHLLAVKETGCEYEAVLNEMVFVIFLVLVLKQKFMWRGIIMEITMYYVTGNNRKWFNFKKNVSAYADEPVRNHIDFERMIYSDDYFCQEKSVAYKKTMDIIKGFNVPLIVEHIYLKIDGVEIYSSLPDLLPYPKMCIDYDGREALITQQIVYTFGKEIVQLELIINGSITKDVKGSEYFLWNSFVKPKNAYLRIARNNIPYSEIKIMEYKNQYIDIDESNTIEQQNPQKEQIIIKDVLHVILLKLLSEDLEKGVLDTFTKLEAKNSSNLQDLKYKIQKKQVILFAGAGVSRTLGLVGWYDLVQAMGEDLGFDKNLFIGDGHDLLVLAEYYTKQKSLADIVKTEFIEKAFEARVKLIKSKIYKYLYDLNFPIIYTTNYDDFIEKYYDSKKEEGYSQDYFKITKIRDCSDFDSNKTPIIKLHGDFSNLDEIVLSERSFYNRIDLNSPLDNLFKADMIKKSVLFIGYSLSDINVRNWINKLSSLWEEGDAVSCRNESFFYNHCYNLIQADILEEKGIHTITSSFNPYSIKSSDILKLYIENDENINSIDEFISLFNEINDENRISYLMIGDKLEEIIEKKDGVITKIYKKFEFSIEKNNIKNEIDKFIEAERNNFYMYTFNRNSKNEDEKIGFLKNLESYIKSIKEVKKLSEQYIKLLENLVESITLLEEDTEFLNRINILENNLKDMSNAMWDALENINKLDKENITDHIANYIIYNYMNKYEPLSQANTDDETIENLKRYRLNLTDLSKEALYIDLRSSIYYRLAMEKFLYTLLGGKESYYVFHIAIKLLIKDKNEEKYLIFKRQHNRAYEHTWENFGYCMTENECITHCIDRIIEQLKKYKGVFKTDEFIYDKTNVFKNLICVSSFNDNTCKTLLLTFLVLADCKMEKNEVKKIQNDSHEALGCYDYETMINTILPKIKDEYQYYNTKCKIDEIIQ